MAERTTRRRKKKEKAGLEKPTKEETAVARHLRFNLPTKSTSIDGHKVEYFTGSKAVDFLQDSKWASGKGNTDIIFSDRESIAHYLDGLLWKGLFYRALKVVSKKSKKEGKEKEEGSSKKEKKTKKEKKKQEAEGDGKEKEEAKEDGGGTKEGGKDGGKDETPPTKKRDGGKKKIKLELTDDQKFVDGNDAFVWVYDPVRPMNYVYGFGLVIGAIAVCLFPLWPPWMRVGTYYLSLCGAGFVGAILALAILRLILYVLTWGATFGKIDFWLFPNLLADVGIKESFMPFYECEIKTKKEDEKGEKSKAEDDASNDKNDGDAQQQQQQQQPGDQPTTDTSPDSVPADAPKNIPENIGSKDDELSDKGDGTTQESQSDVTEEKSVDSADDDDENGDGFEMIDEEEISEVCEGSGGSQLEEEE